VQRLYQALLAVSVALGAYGSGVLETLELAMLESRFDIVTRPASGDIVAVQIDASTIKKLGQWPLPRNTYAFAVRALTAAGASEIAIDVDMSARTNPNETAALADALKDAGGHVILPAFTQLAVPGDIDAGLIDARPHETLGPNAWLGSVTVIPDADGRLRQLIYGMRGANDEFHYSMFALLAGKAKTSPQPFYVDYGIDVSGIPRISFADVMAGDFSVEAVNGKRIIIGGTAVELGDHFAVPRYGVMSGPMVQAMGFETLYQDRSIHRTGTFAVVLSVLLIVGFAVWLPTRWGWRARGMTAIAALVLLAASAVLAQAAAAISIDTIPMMLALVTAIGTQIMLVADVQQTQAARQKRIAAYQRILLHRVVSDSFDGIVILDENGQVETANDRSFELCGVLPQESGSSLDELFSELSFEIERPDDGWHTLPRGDRFLATRDDGGEKLYVELVINRSKVPDTAHTARGHASRIVFGLTIRDVTDGVRAVTAMKEAREQAERANRAKTDFLANMSHELRTPLNAIIGFSQIMASEASGPVGHPDYLEYAGHIHEGGRHLLSIVTDILDISRVEMGDMPMVEDELSLAEITESAIAVARDDVALSGSSIETDFDPAVPNIFADAHLVQQAIRNLLTNAGKAYDGGGKIYVRCHAGPDGSVIVEVEDEGRGIPETMLSSILMPFQQVQRTANRTAGGVGMGLTIVAAFMKLHDGDLQIDSRLKEGTTARLVFPASRVKPADSRMATSA